MGVCAPIFRASGSVPIFSGFDVHSVRLRCSAGALVTANRCCEKESMVVITFISEFLARPYLAGDVTWRSFVVASKEA